jgi:hypothetical protein
MFCNLDYYWKGGSMSEQEKDKRPSRSQEVPSRKPQIGPSPTDGDTWFERLQRGVERDYGRDRKPGRRYSGVDDYGEAD